MTTLPPAVANQADIPEDPSVQADDTTPQTVDPRLEEAKNYIINIVREIDKQERPTREIQIKIWKYLDLLWTGIANFYWNSQTNQWSPITYDDLRHLSETADVDPTLMNKTVNMLRPYGESIVGVLTTTLPRNKYYPADADCIDDINTAKAYVNIERKISRDNEMKTKIVQMIVQLLIGGFFGIYNYSHSSHKYGTVVDQTMKEESLRITSYECPECGYEIVGNQKDLSSLDQSEGVEQGLDETINEPFEEQEEQDEQEDQQEYDQLEQQVMAVSCPNCQSLVQPMTTVQDVTQEVPDKTEITPKSRQIIEVFGPMELKIPTHASKKEEVLWCILEQEVHESLARTLYPQHRDQIMPGSHTDLAYDRWARSQYENMGELNQYYVTMRKVWLRPSAYEVTGQKECSDLLKELYPGGVLAVFSTNEFLFCEEADMDDCWTFSLNPIYKRLYGDPLLKAGIPLQETANDLFQAEVETFKHAIPITFADPEALNFETFSSTKNQPGSVYPMKPVAGKSLADSITQTSVAHLPQEAEVLEAKVEKLFQFVLGVFPSVFGGPSSGSKTLGEYEQSRGQALQRLNINPWEVINAAYAQMMGKAIKAYADDLLEDEAYVEQKGNSFVNVWIRKAELQGQIGEVKPELSDQFPTTWGQKKAAWLELVGLNNEMITSILFHPENAGLISQILSIDDLYIPGDDQRNKQLEEIRQLIQAAPEPQMDPNGQPIISPESGQPVMQATVHIEPVDDNSVHIAVLSAFICSAVGQALKENNPGAYANLMLHYQEHEMALQQEQMQQAMMANMSQGGPKQDGPGNKDQKEAPTRDVKESR